MEENASLSFAHIQQREFRIQFSMQIKLHVQVILQHELLIKPERLKHSQSRQRAILRLELARSSGGPA